MKQSAMVTSTMSALQGLVEEKILDNLKHIFLLRMIFNIIPCENFCQNHTK